MYSFNDIIGNKNRKKYTKEYYKIIRHRRMRDKMAQISRKKNRGK